MIRYQVVDSKTDQVIATYHNFKYATNRADELDWEYGAVRYVVKKVETPNPAPPAPRA